MRFILFILVFIAVSFSVQALSFLGKDGFGLKNYPGDIRSRSMGLTGLTLSDSYNSSLMNPAVTSQTKTIIFGFGETASMISLSYNRFSDYTTDDNSFDMPYMNVIFPMVVKGLVVSAYYTSPLNSYFQGSFTQDSGYETPDTVTVEYYKNFNIVGFSTAYELPFKVSLSVGLECAFGNDKTKYSVTNSEFTINTMEAQWEYGYTGYTPKFGFYYSNHGVSLGATYRSSMDISTIPTYNDIEKAETTWLYPSEIGIGLGYSNEKFTVSGEYITEKWSETTINGYGATEDLTRIGFGGEYRFSFNWKFLRDKEKKIEIPLRAGYYIQKGLYREGKESAFSFGTAFKPFKTNNASIDLLLSFGSREMLLVDRSTTNLESMYKEDFITFGVSFTAKDLWFRDTKKK